MKILPFCFLLLFGLPVAAQFTCTMPNGAVVVSRLSPCPADAVKAVAADGTVLFDRPKAKKPRTPAPDYTPLQQIPPLQESRQSPAPQNYSSVDAEKTQVAMAWRLASLNANRLIEREHITVARFTSLLRQLDATFVESDVQLGEMSVKAIDLLKKEGIQENLLNFMEGMNQVFVQNIENQKFSEYAGKYIALRSAGYSHENAIIGIRSLVLRIMSTR